jgi:hypothetical protein
MLVLDSPDVMGRPSAPKSFAKNGIILKGESVIVAICMRKREEFNLAQFRHIGFLIASSQVTGWPYQAESDCAV